MSADLNLTVGAEIGNLTSNLDKGSAKVKQFARESGSALAGLDAKGFKPMVKGANQASFALTNLGRVAQDAPFGFIGIQNNLNPLLESFQRLQKETGSSMASLKALGSSLIGAGGIGLGLSLISSLFLTYGQQIKDFLRNTSDAAKAQRDLTKALVDSAASVQGEISVLQGLVKVAQDVNLTNKARQQAINKLNEEYKSFNNSLSLSNINTEKSIGLIDRQTQAMVTQAKIQGLQNLITKETQKQADILTSDIEENLTFFDKIKIAAIGGANIISGVNFTAQKAFERTGEVIDKSKKRVTAFTDALNQLLKDAATGGELFIKPEKVKVDGKVKIKNIELDPSGINFIQPFTSELYITTTAEGIRNAKKEAEQRLKDIRLIFPAEIKPILDIKNSPLRDSKYKLSPEDIIDINQWRETMGEIETELVGELIMGITSALTGNGGGLRDAFKGMLTLVGDFLIQLGKAAVKAALVAQALKFLQKNPITGLIAGLSAIALGSLIKNSIPKFATGVTNFSGGQAIVGERGPELLTLPKGSSITPNDKLGQAAGAGMMVMIPELSIRGNDLRILFNRAGTANNRRF